MSRRGSIALVGAGEFLPAMADFDRDLLEATGRLRPRVAVLPTASWPDGEAAFHRWAAMGVEHFSALGAEVEPVLVRGRAEAGAMALADRQWDFRRRMLPWPLRWRRGLGIVAGLTVIPGYDAWPESVAALMALQAPRGSTVVGIDRETAVVGRDGTWQVHGRSRVTVWRGRHHERFRAGEAFRL